MLRWKETRTVFEQARALAQRGETAALATVIRVCGSSYRKPGAKLLIDSNGACFGGVSAGCLEHDVVETARIALRKNRGCVRRYDTAADDSVFGLDTGCGGTLEVFVRPFTPHHDAAWGQRAIDMLGAETPVVVSTLIVESSAVASDVLYDGHRSYGSTKDTVLDRGIAATAATRWAAWHAGAWTEQTAIDHIAGANVFTEIVVPAPRVLVFGARADARATARLAGQVGFRVARIDSRPGDSWDVRPDARTHAVVMTHSWARDRAWVARLARTETCSIGLLGPRPRSERLLASLGLERDARVRSPVGTPCHAEGPNQIAVSIVSELLTMVSSVQPSTQRRSGARHAFA